METLISFIAEPLSLDFMRRAFFMSASVGIVCSIFSCFLVLKGWSLMGDAVSHAILPGMAFAYLISVPIALGAFASGLFCALAIGFLKQNSRIKEDAIMGIVFSGMFAAGLVMVSKIETDFHLLHVLFGNVLGISKGDIIETTLIGAVCTIVMLAKRRDLALHCFDEIHASVIGLPVKALHFSFLVLLALTIVAALKAVGIILVVAMLVAPGAIGYIFARSFDQMLLIAVSTTLFSCFSGVLISYHFDAATGPLIVVIEALLFIVPVLITRILKLGELEKAVQPTPLSAGVFRTPIGSEREKL
ncbi:MAG: metal ABC transporter permease [Pseudomonadota bacterium]